MGFGNPPLCRSCAVAIELELERASPLADLLEGLDRLLTRRRVIAPEVADLIARALRSGPRPRRDVPPGFREATEAARAPHGASAAPGRRAAAPPPPPPPPAPDPRALAARSLLGFGPRQPLSPEIIRTRRQKLARTHHPDRGGKTGTMQAVNAACDLLLADLAAGCGDR